MGAVTAEVVSRYPRTQPDSVHVVDVSVAIVVDAVVGDLTGVHPQVVANVVVEHEARVDHRDGHPDSGGDIPRRFGSDVVQPQRSAKGCPHEPLELKYGSFGTACR